MNRRYRKVILDNGITLFIHSDKNMRKTLFSYTVNYGSSGEYFNFNYNGKDYNVLPGCAHFLEHMLLERSPYGNLFNYLKNLKYRSNAYTGLNITKFYFSGTTKIKSSIKKMILSLEKPIFKDIDIKETSHAIEEETKLGLNRPLQEASLLAARNSFDSFEYVHDSLSVIGTEETTKSLDYNMLKLCYDAFYTDDNKMITIVGNIDEDDMINYIKGIYSKIKPHKNNTKINIPNNLNKIRKKNDILIRNSVEDTNIIINYNNVIKGFSRFEISYYIRFLSSSLFANYSDFYQRLKKDGILVMFYGEDYEFVYTNFNFYFGFTFVVKDTNKFLNEYHKEINNKKFDKHDFELFKKSLLSGKIYSEDDKYIFYTFLTDTIIDYSEELDEVEELQKLSFERFNEFIKCIDFNNELITILTREV